MKKEIVFGLIFLMTSVLFQGLPVQAQTHIYSPISLKEENVILTNSDVELMTFEEESIYAVVCHQKKYYLFSSQNGGRTWQKSSGQGLPEREKFISLKSLANQPEVVALSTSTRVYLSYDRGESFSCLGSPPELIEEEEEITSLAISAGNPPRILVGVWHPGSDKFAREGAYLWGEEGKSSWELQGMRPTWQGRGYWADVTSVSFSPDPSIILAVATGDPDGSGILPEGTYLNIGYLNQRGVFGAEWNFLSGWPVEIAESPGLSPTEKEILSSQFVFPEDLEFEESEEVNFYLLYNTRDKDKDGVYKIEDGKVRQLELPKYPETVSLDSLDYVGSSWEGTLVVGVTSKDRDKKNQAHVYYLDTDEERFTPPYWSEKWMRVADTQNCQVAFSPDFAESEIIFAATSGKNSSFARSDKNILVPISLMDISGGINLLSPSSRFLVDGTLFLNYGNKNILKVRLDQDCRLEHAERILYIPEGFSPARMGIEAISNYRIFIWESGTKKSWLTENGGLSWSSREREPEIVDAVADQEMISIASKDGMIYWYNHDKIGGSWEERISSGIRWLQKIESGPGGKILAVGASEKENVFDTISLVGDERFTVLPPLPASSRYLEVVYSPQDESIYCGVDRQLYRLINDEDWQEITRTGRIYKILPSSQGLYLFCQSKVYFSPFPLTEDSQWEALGGDELRGSWSGCQLVQLEEKEDLLFLWDSSKIRVWTHQFLEEKPEEEIPPQPVEPEPEQVEPESVEPEQVEPESVEPEPVEPEPSVQPELVEPSPVQPPAETEAAEPQEPVPSEKPERGCTALIVTVIILSLIVVFLIFIIIRMRRLYYF